MKPKEELFRLINTLNKAEKGYFKKFTGIYSGKGEASYLRLFSQIESQPSYDEAMVKNAFGDSAFGKFLSANKAYLFRLILKSLRNFYSDASIDSQVGDMVREVEILYNRGLLEEASRHAHKTMEKAEPQELFHHILNLYFWQSRIFIARGYTGLNQENLDAFYKKWHETTERLTNSISYDELSSNVYYLVKKCGHPSTDEELKRYALFLENPYLNNIELAKSFRARLKYFNIKIVLLALLGKKEESYLLTRAYASELEGNIEFLEKNPTFYISCLEKLVYLCDESERWDEMHGWNEKIREIIERIPTRSTDDYLLFYYAMHASWLIQTHRFDEMETFRAEAEMKFPLPDGSVDLLKETILFLHITLFDVMNGNWTSVFRRCNKALEFPINEKTADVNRLLKYLSLISCYETGEFELLKSRLRSFKRDATHKQPLSFREKASISYFTKLSTHPTPKKKKEILEKHIEEISTYKAKFRGEDHFEDLYYTEYLKASLSGKTVGETLKSLS